MKKKGISLFTKYYIAVGTGILASFLVLSVMVMFFVNNYLLERNTELLRNNTAKIAAGLQSDETDIGHMTTGDREILRYTLEIFSSANDADILVLDTDGRVVVSGQEREINMDGLVLPDEIMNTVKENSKGVLTFKAKLPEFSPDNAVMISKAVGARNNAVSGYVVTVTDMNMITGNINGIFRILLMSVLAALIIAVAIVYFLAYRTLKPLKQLSFATKKIASGDYSYRVEIDGDNEFRELGDAFNDMARSLSTLESSRRSFIANISHELKTPMTTIGGFVDGIIDGTISKEKQNEYLKIVSSEVKRLARLVVAMLDLSKIEAGELTLKKEKVDVSRMVFRVLLSFEQMIEKQNIEIRGLDKMPSITIDVDKDMIYQVFYNLVDNAVKFTDKGGYIAVAGMLMDDKYVFRIKNKCHGISTEEMSKIFERFYKVDKSHSREVKGVGLGLYLVKTIVEMHGGQITVMSEEGENCEFLFWIPVENNL